MRAGLVVRIERGVGWAASTLFAGACGYAAYAWLAVRARQPMLGVEAALAAALGFVIASRFLDTFRDGRREMPLPIFDVREVEPLDGGELLLTERFEGSMEEVDALLLDDVLSELKPESRVVRLFDPASMPTAGELKSRIDRHLDPDAAAAQASDAAQALHDALAELRRSIR